MAHPVRLRILSLLTGSTLTAAEVARELGITHANASYHLRHLLAAGTVEIAGEERIRGATAKRYRYDMGRDLNLSGTPRTDGAARAPRQRFYGAVADELRRRAARIKPTANRTHATDAELWIDPAVWEQLKSTVDDVSDRLHRAARPAREPGAILVSATYVMFEMRA
jgi:DNA-binding transcriptional ArsR family regulator